MTSCIIADSSLVCRLLKGVLCLYKPSGISESAVKYALLTKLCRELNEMQCRPPLEYVSIEGNTTKEMLVKVGPNFADNPLVVGPRYQEKDFKCTWALPLGVHTSGVLLMGLNDGVRTMSQINKAHHIRSFHIHGQLGHATDTFFIDGRVTERSKFRHVTCQRMDKYLASVQAAHQRSMFELSGVSIQSQDAYELAIKGLIRPSDPNVPMIYGIRCIEFKPPNFTIEVHSTNEYEFYLKSLINEIGIKMHTNAVCTKIRCIRHSCFTVHNALLRKHWALEHVITNLQDNEKILEANPEFFTGVLKNAQINKPRNKEQLIS